MKGYLVTESQAFKPTMVHDKMYLGFQIKDINECAVRAACTGELMDMLLPMKGDRHVRSVALMFHGDYVNYNGDNIFLVTSITPSKRR